MKKKTVRIDRSYQFDLLGKTPPAIKQNKCTLTESGRRFTAPHSEDIYLGMTRLDHYLKQAGLSTPLLVATSLNRQDWSEFEARYAPTGRAPYAPRAMMGLILFGVMQGIDSLRCLERFARQDLGCMWVTGGICPDHASIGRFIILHEESMSSGFFESLTRAALKATGSDGNNLAGDGTVVEAACSHYNLLRKEAAKDQAEMARSALESSPEDKQLQHKSAQANQAEAIFNSRKQSRINKSANTDSLAVSPTEPEAMVQPQKRGRGKAPSYKPSVLANDKRIILAYDIDPSQEISVISTMLDQSKRVTGEEAKELLLDAGYCYMPVIKTTLDRDISLLCPEGKGAGVKRKGKIFVKSQFRYIKEEDVYLCPAEQRLYPGSKNNIKYVMYRTSACKSCQIKDQCTSAKAGRRIRRLDSDEVKEALYEVMQHPQAQKAFHQRQAMVEPVFSVLKQVQGLTRFRRRGLSGVKRELTLHVLAYNLKRMVLAYICMKLTLSGHLKSYCALLLASSQNTISYDYHSVT